MQTATNPQTGETAVLVGGAWKKAEQIAANDKGEKAYLVEGSWITDNGGDAPKSQGSITRAAGLATRAVGPIAAGAAAGAAIGAPLGGVGAIPGAIAGAGAAGITQIVDSVLGTNYLERGMDAMGLPRPESSGERITSDVMRGVAGGAASAGVGSVLQAANNPVVQGVGRTLTSNLGLQTAANVGASGSSAITRESGGGPVAQLAAGLVGGVVAPAAVQGLVNAPRNMLANSIRKSDAKPFAVEGERLANATGMELSLGARTGNRQVLGLENAARQYGPTADRVQDIDVNIANQAIKRVTQLADSITKTKTDPATIGTRIQETVKGAANKLDLIRDQSAAKDYGLVRELAGDRPVIKMDNFVGELRKLIDEYTNVAGSDAQKIVSQATAALQKVTQKVAANPGGKVLSATGDQLIPGTPSGTATVSNNVNDAMRSRRFYGAASRGSANVFEDIAPDMNRTIGSRLFRAINQDFDESAVNAGGALRKALDAANGNYRKYSESLEFLEKSTLGKLVGDDIADAAISGQRMNTTSGEAVVSKIMSSHPSTRRAAIDILQRWNPSVVKDVKAFVLRDALDKGMSIAPSSKGASQVPLSFNKFISALQGEKTSFGNQLESYGFTAKEIADVKDTVAAMMRAGDKTGYNFSGTEVMRQNMEIIGAVGDAARGNIAGLASKTLSIGGKVLGLNKIADGMATAHGRAALRTLVSRKPTPQALAAAMSTLSIDTETGQATQQ